MAAPRVLFYVQHLLGMGHLRRAVTLVDAMTGAGLEVTLVTGGVPVPGLRVAAAHCVQLAPASASDLTFKSLLDADGRPVDEHWKQARREQLLAAWRLADPQVVVIELFPFGRRQMRFELLPLLDAVRSVPRRALIVSSVRDVLGGGQTDPARQDQMLESFERYFDHVMVHGDPSLIGFDRTFRHAGRLGERLHYTGYVVEPASAVPDAGLAGKDEVIVSVGGGAVGRTLLETALQARPLSTLRAHRWRLLAGVHAGAADLARLRDLAGGEDGVVVERYRRDFAQMLGRCRLSISQGGYNTVMELLQARAAAVVVPFSAGAEIEQSMRARLLADKGWIEMLEERDLGPVLLARAIDRAAERPAARAGTVDMDGARRSAALVARWAAEQAR